MYKNVYELCSCILGYVAFQPMQVEDFLTACLTHLSDTYITSHWTAVVVNVAQVLTVDDDFPINHKTALDAHLITTHLTAGVFSSCSSPSSWCRPKSCFWSKQITSKINNNSYTATMTKIKMMTIIIIILITKKNNENNNKR